MTIQRGLTVGEALSKKSSIADTAGNSSAKETRGSVHRTGTRKKKGQNQPKEEKEMTLVCNTQYNPNFRPKTKRVQFIDDFKEEESPSPSRVKNIVGLFDEEREIADNMPEEPKAYVYIKMSDLKYDRNDLFDNVPVFKYPLIGYNEHARRNKLWLMIKRAIFSPFPEEKRHFLRLIEASQEMMYNDSER